MPKKSHYEGREHSFIKHLFLEKYLEQLFLIIGQREKEICYVDCFSGPWMEANENLSGTSIVIAVEVMRKTRNTLKKIGKDVKFKALFVEKNTNSFQKLTNYLGKHSSDGIDAKSLNGEFHLLCDEILKWCGSRSFAFFFVDPKGWKNAIEIPNLRPLIERPRSELLINFMYMFISRAHNQELFEGDMIRIFGEVIDLLGFDPNEKETYMIEKYRERLRGITLEENQRTRAAYVSILDPVKDRTKYHLVYLTKHPLGIIKFMEISEKVQVDQNKVRTQTKQQLRIQKSGQQELCWEEQDANHSASSVFTLDIEDYWVKKLTQNAKQFNNFDLADMLEETDWFESDFQRAFKALEKSGHVENLDSKSKRPKNPVHFKKNERC